MKDLLQDIRACQTCTQYLEFGPRPIVQAHPDARIIIIGQAPGSKVHKSGIPWDDQSGDRLREWLGVSKNTFYDPSVFAHMPMGFCYPGKGKSGDLPPRKECAPQWHELLLQQMPKLELFLLFGQYAQNYYLAKKKKKNLTETVLHYSEYLPKFLPMPHPSPRNIRWFRRNSWFEMEVIPLLQARVKLLINNKL